MSTSFLSPIFFPDLVTKQIRIKLAYIQMVHLQFPNLWTLNCLPILMRIQSYSFLATLCIVVFSGWLIPHSTHVAYYYLVHGQNTHWIQMRMPTDLRILRKVDRWPLREILQPVWFTFPSRCTKWKTQTITTNNSNSLRCISLSSFYCFG